MDKTETATISEPGRQLPVTAAYDVIVVGGGLAGVTAAVAAARTGVSVCLLEKAFALGGLATLGQVTVWLPLCDGFGRQVTGGLAEELFKLSIADLQIDNKPAHFWGIPEAWLEGGDLEARKKKRFEVRFNPTAYMLALEKLLLDEGVALLYDTRVCQVRRGDDKITHLIIENKSGRSAMACGVVIDASGDADVCFLAGEPTESLDGNVPAGWFYTLRKSGLHLQIMTKAPKRDGSRPDGDVPFFRGDDAASVTAQIVTSRAIVRERVAALCEKHPDEEIQPFSVPTLPCFRMSRRLLPSFSLSDAHRHQYLEDTLGLISDWRWKGPVYPIPLRSMIAPYHRNLLAVGRCMGSDTSVWDVTRCFPGCCASGEAAGVSAAIAVRQTGGDVHTLSIPILQSHLREAGVLLDPQLIEPACMYNRL